MNSSLTRRTSLTRTNRLRRRPKVGASTLDRQAAAAWKRTVCGPKARCLGCGSTQRLDAHHVVPQRAIKGFVSAQRLPADEAHEELRRLLWNTDNGIPLCRSCHEFHERAVRRLPRERLPQTALAFARQLGPWAEGRIEREYAA